MPTVPTLDAPRVSPQAPQAPQASANAFGAGVGRAMQGFGQQVQRSSDAMFEIAQERKRKVQGPKDQLFNATANLRRSETYRNTLNEFSSSGAINDPDYDKKFREVLEKADQDIVKSLLSEGYRPSPEAITRSDLDKLNIQEQFFAQAIAKKDQVEQINIVTGVEENILKIQQTASESGQIDQSHEQIQEALATAKQVMRPEQYARLEADTRAGQGNMVITHLSKLQEYNIDGNATPEQLEGLITQGQAAVDKAVALQYLSPAKAEELKMDFALGVRRRTIQAMEPLKRQRLFTGTTGNVISDSVQGSMDLIRGEEGFLNVPKMDVNHLRGGYGTDTFTHPDGRVEEVTAATRFTQEDAERDLQRRTREFQDRGRNQTEGKWDELPPNVQVGLTSVLYNYGSLPDTVVRAVKTGDTESIARAVEALDHLPARRKREAAIIRGGELPVGSGPDNAYTKNLPGDVRQELYQQAISDQQRIDAAELAQLRAAQSQQSDALTLRIEQAQAGRGPMPLHSEIDELVQANVIDAGQGAAAYQRIGQANEQNKALTAAIARDQGGGAYNPYNPDDTKMGNLVFDHMNKQQRMPDSAVVDWVKTRQMVPDSAVADIRNGMNSPDVGIRTEALNRGRAINEVSPNGLLNAAHGKEVSDAVTAFNTLVSAAPLGGRGMDPQEATRLLMEMETREWKAQRALLEAKGPGGSESPLEKFTKGIESSDVESMLDPGMLTNQGKFDTPMEAFEATRLARELAAEGMIHHQGQEDLALSYMQKELKRIYGNSEVAGPGRRVMKFPPELFLPSLPGIGHGYIRPEIERDIGTLLKEGETLREYRLQSFMQPDGSGTADDVQRKRMPGYRIEYLKEGPDGRTWELAPGVWALDPERFNQLKNEREAVVVQGAREGLSRFEVREQSQENFERGVMAEGWNQRGEPMIDVPKAVGGALDSVRSAPPSRLEGLIE